MFDAVRNNKRIVQGFLLLITLPFAFWGVDSYIRGGAGGEDVAKVGSVAITQAQFQRALMDEKDALRQRLGAQFQPAMLEQPALREQLVNDLVNRSLLGQEATKLRLFVSNQALRQYIAAVPQLQEGGLFSQARYEAFVAAQGMSVELFESRLRQDLLLQQLMSTVGQTGAVPATVTDQIIAVQTQVRQVQELPFSVERYLAQVKLTPAEVQSYYDQNTKSYALPEQVKVEYVVLSGAALRQQVTVSDAEIRAAYESSKDRWLQPEERRASHILIAVDSKAPAAEQDKAKATAAALLTQVKANPARFAELAKQASQDPGSARVGGDLGYFGKGAMVRPFEEAVWRLKEGEISDVVQSDFGLHIIRLTGIKGGQFKPLDAVRATLESELREQAQSRKFAEAAENFGNLVYEQSDTLQPAAEKFRLVTQTSGWLTQAGQAKDPILSNAKVLSAVFSDDALKYRRNTQAIDLGHDSLVSLRVVDFKAATVQPLEAVRGDIETLLKRQAAMALAKDASEEALKTLQSGKDAGFTWAATKSVSRMDARALAPQAIGPVFQISSASVPGYTRVEIPGQGFIVYKLLKVQDDAFPAAQKPALTRAVRQQLNGIWAQEDAHAYLASLRERYKVEINKKAMLENAAQ